MRIIGIDPGYAIMGWGIVDYVGNRRINVLLINHKSYFWTKKYPYFA